MKIDFQYCLHARNPNFTKILNRKTQNFAYEGKRIYSFDDGESIGEKVSWVLADKWKYISAHDNRPRTREKTWVVFMCLNCMKTMFRTSAAAEACPTSGRLLYQSGGLNSHASSNLVFKAVLKQRFFVCWCILSSVK
jgi:hypothetical protein